MLTDGGLCSGPRSNFEEEQGVEADDDETKTVEGGEFCQPSKIIPTKRKQATTSVGSTATTAGKPSAKAKRARS